MQLPAFQPMPTRCPTLSPLAAGPTATTRPTASWPRTAGNCESPQSLLSMEMSEWHRPQCSTCTSTSSAPSRPSSTCCRTNLLLTVAATHASIIAIGVLQKESRTFVKLDDCRAWRADVESPQRLLSGLLPGSRAWGSPLDELPVDGQR